jgi:hypothetical protein
LTVLDKSDLVILMRRFSLRFWAILAAGVALALLALSELSYREARSVKLVIGIILVSFLFFLKGRSRENGRS